MPRHAAQARRLKKQRRPGSNDPGRRREQPVSRVLYGAEAPWQPFLWERSHLRPRAAYPRRLDRSGRLLAAYLALLQRGLPCRLRYRKARWALTPPFHPYHDLLWRSVFCGTIRHGAKPCPGVTWHFAHGARTFLRRDPSKRNVLRLPGCSRRQYNEP